METTIMGYIGIILEYIGIIGYILGLYRDNGEMETTIIHWGYVGVMEKKMETIIMLFC